MRTVSLLAVFLAFVSSPLVSQITTPVATPPLRLSPVHIVQSPGSQGCPVQLTAAHSREPGVVKVSPGSTPPGQGYSLTFRPTNSRGIRQAEVTFHGLAGAQVVPVKDHPAADATEDFTVSPSAGSNRLFQSVVYAHKLTGVQWIEIDELTFADGTHWQKSADSYCRVAPNGFMAVTSAKN